MTQTVYTYYEAGEEFGSLGDLKTATDQVLQGTTWVSVGTTYFRYYINSAGGIGFVHGMKYRINPESFQRLSADPNGFDPLIAPDSVVAQYADVYYEYDLTHSQRVAKCVINGGLLSYTYAYTESSNSDDYNNWALKSVETRPDGSQLTTYANYVSQTMLTDLASHSGSGAQHWVEYHHYDTNGHEDQHAMPSAVTSYDDTHANLNVMLNSSGLLYLTTYYTSTGSGGYAGYKQFDQVQQGTDTGTTVNLREYKYTSHSILSGPTIVLQAALIVYQSDSGGGSDPTTTSINYSAFLCGYEPSAIAGHQAADYFPGGERR